MNQKYNDFRIEYSRMSRDLCFLWYIKKQKAESRYRIRAHKRIFAVWFSKKIKSEQSVFNLEKTLIFRYS